MGKLGVIFVLGGEAFLPRRRGGAHIFSKQLRAMQVSLWIENEEAFFVGKEIFFLFFSDPVLPRGLPSACLGGLGLLMEKSIVFTTAR